LIENLTFPLFISNGRWVIAIAFAYATLNSAASYMAIYLSIVMPALQLQIVSL